MISAVVVTVLETYGTLIIVRSGNNWCEYYCTMCGQGGDWPDDAGAGAGWTKVAKQTKNTTRKEKRCFERNIFVG